MFYKKHITQIILFCAINTWYFSLKAQPDTIAGLSLWLKADSGVILDLGGNVKIWKDFSPNQYDFYQSDSLFRALYTTSFFLNNKPTLYFDGINDYYTKGDILNLTDNGKCFFLVAKINNNNGAFFSKSLYGSASGRYAFFAINNEFVFLYQDDANRNISYPLNNNFNLFEIFVEKPHSLLQLLENSHLKAETTINGNFDMTSNFDFIIGAYNNNSGTIPPLLFLNGEIAEIMVFDRILNISETQNVETYLMDKYAPPINLANDTLLHSFCPFTIKTQGYFTSFLWSDGSTADSLVVTKSGNYKITATDIFGRQSVDSISVQFPTPNFLPTYAICLDDSAYVNSQLGNSISYLWSNGNTQSYDYIKNEGLYFVTLTDTYSCTMVDSFYVDVDSLSSLPLFANDTLHLCEGNRLHIDQNLTNIVHYFWQPTGDTLSYTTVLSSDYYSLSIENVNGCTQRDSIFIHVLGKTPIVNFSASHTCKGDSTHFTDLSTSIDTSTIIFWQWIIGNDTLNEQNPSYFFQQYGMYNINLMVETNVGCFQSNEQAIEVFPLPVCDFKAIRLCSRHNTYFSSLSSVPTGFISKLTWNWGDGTTNYDNDTIHTFDLPGNYTVTLTVESNEGCIDSISKTIEIKPSPFAGFDASASCDNNPTFFVDTSKTEYFNPILQWNWLFGDGAIANTQHPHHIYNATGHYNVMLIIKTLNGCIDSAQQTITVSTKPHANFSADSACLGQPMYIQDLSDINNGQIIEWNWYVHSHFFSSQQNPIYIPSELNNLLLTLIVKSNTQCTDTISKSILVYPLPNVQFDLNPNYGAVPLTVEFENLSESGDVRWNFGDNSFSNQNNPIHVFQDSGLYYVWLTVTNIHGCKDSISKTVLVVPNLLDLAIEKISYTKQSDYIFIHTLLSNLGTLPIEKPVLNLVVDGKTFVSEIVNDTIFSGEKRNYTFNGILPIESGLPKYLCINGTVLTNQNDINLSNNENCLSFNNEEQILNLFPNPAYNQLFMLFQLNEEQDVVFSIIDITGKTIYQHHTFLKNEIHKLIFDIQSLSQGVYTLQVKTKKHTFVNKFIKN